MQLTTDKSITIKSATDNELYALINRLRNEREAQRIIQDLRNNSVDLTVRPTDGSPAYYDNNVSTEVSVNDLYHHGVLGMKWGVRKKRSGGKTTKSKKTSSSKTKKKEQPETKSSGYDLSQDYLIKLKLKGKPLSAMSNAEIRTFNERMNLEKTFAQLTAKQPNKYTKIAMELVSGAAKEVAKELVKQNMKKVASYAFGETEKKKKS